MATKGRRARLEALREAMRGGGESVAPDGAPGWSPALAGGLHEWFGGEAREQAGVWMPALSVLIGLAWRTVERDTEGGRVVWVGRGCWAYPPAMVRVLEDGTVDDTLLARSVFVDASSVRDRVWSIEHAARCSGAAMVIADGRRLTMTLSRRVQLAAASGEVPVQACRTGRERGELSAAATRWVVTPGQSGHAEGVCIGDGEGDELVDRDRREWTVELLRRKGLRPGSGGHRRWVVRRDDENGRVDAWRARGVGVAPEPVGRGDLEAGPAVVARRA